MTMTKSEVDQKIKNKESLRGADLQEANLRGANLQGVDLQGAKLQGAELQEADLREAKLQGAELQEANLRRANLREADLREADLRGADLQEADLRGANLQGVDFSFFNISIQCGFSYFKIDSKSVWQIVCHLATLDFEGKEEIIELAKKHLEENPRKNEGIFDCLRDKGE